MSEENAQENSIAYLDADLHFELNKLIVVLAALRTFVDNTEKGTISNSDSDLIYGCVWSMEDILPRIHNIKEQLNRQDMPTTQKNTTKDNPAETTDKKPKKALPYSLDYGHNHSITLEDLVAKAALLYSLTAKYMEDHNNYKIIEPLSYPEAAGLFDLAGTIYHALSQNVYPEKATSDTFL